MLQCYHVKMEERKMKFRIATVEDTELLVDLRKKQLADEGAQGYKHTIDKELHEFFTKALTNGDLIQVIAMDEEQVIGTGGIGFYTFPPGYENPTGRKAYISSIYTAPSYRRQGVASAIMGELMEIGKQEGMNKFWLYASTEGKPLYKRFDFAEADDYMDITLVDYGEVDYVHFIKE